MASITPNIEVPARSRNFSQDDAQAVLDLLTGAARVPVLGENGQPQTDDEGNPVTQPMDEPARTVGFGEFPTAGAARSAGVTLNRLLLGLGAPHKYAVTSFERGGRYIGVMRNEKAKEAPTPKSTNGGTPAKATPKK